MEMYCYFMIYLLCETNTLDQNKIWFYNKWSPEMFSKNTYSLKKHIEVNH